MSTYTTDMLENIGEKAREAARALALATTEEKNDALERIALALRSRCGELCAANEKDLVAGKTAGLSDALLDRLTLSRERVEAIADAMEAVAALPDPVGRVLSDQVRPNGLRIVKTAVPLGVIAVIYEARPNVTADSAALCLKSGNAVILRGGKEAIGSNIAIASVMMHGEYGIEDVCLSTLTLVDRQGVRGKIANHLTDGEVAKLRISAERLKDVIRQIQL